MRTVLVGVAGAAGAISRYGVGVAFGARSFPWPTLGINVVGSFLLGLVLIAGPARVSPNVTVALAVGFLGAFTTFSTFSYETVTMVRAGRLTAAATYIGISVLAGLAAAALGYRTGQLVA